MKWWYFKLRVKWHPVVRMLTYPYRRVKYRRNWEEVKDLPPGTIQTVVSLLVAVAIGGLILSEIAPDWKPPASRWQLFKCWVLRRSSFGGDAPSL